MDNDPLPGPHLPSEVDEYGVPNTMFGVVPELHYAVVGRVVMVSALLEENLHDLFCAVARAPQGEKAGEPGTILIKIIESHIHRFPAEHRDVVAQFLRDAAEALEVRHEIVHSVWPHGPAGGAHGWRSVPVRKRRAAHEVATWTGVRSDDLPGVVSQLVKLQGRCRMVSAWAQHLS